MVVVRPLEIYVIHAFIQFVKGERYILSIYVYVQRNGLLRTIHGSGKVYEGADLRLIAG